MFKILSLDGGGIRGLLTIIIIQKLIKAFPGWLDKVDLFAGTSTGGILALGLAYGLTPGKLRILYEKKGKKIFDDSIWDNIKDLGNLIGAQYSNKNLEKELKRHFKNKKLSDLKSKVLIPTFDLDNEDPKPKKRHWKSKFFHNFKGDDYDGDELIYKVAMYTSAAPTYFPSVDGYIDGGVIANNPSMAAIAQVLDKRSEDPRPTLNDIILLSISTGKTLFRIEGKNNNWGLSQWVKPLLNVFMEGSVDVASYQCKQILGNRYKRIELVFPPNEVIPIDGVNKIPEIIKIADKYKLSNKIKKWFKKYW
jgi:patatin-like phospholipase/acyl hydrolase